jgi:hypothetical protein
MVEGQDLPEALFAFSEEVSESIRLRPEVADTVFRRQRGYMQQYPTGPFV